jgi:hypothetical protein
MASRLGSFSWGALGAIVVLVAAAIVVPQYSDYRSRAEAYNMLVIAEPLQRSVETHALASHTLQGSGVGVTMAPEFFDAFVQQDGAIILHNRNAFGQLLMLQPTLQGGNITWRCMGGPPQDVPTSCR